MNETDFFRELEKARGEYECLRIIKKYSDGYEKDFLFALKDTLCYYLQGYISIFASEVIRYITNVYKERIEVIDVIIDESLESERFYERLYEEGIKNSEHYKSLKLLLDNTLCSFVGYENEFIAKSEIEDCMFHMNFNAAVISLSLIETKIEELYEKTEVPMPPTSIITSTNIENSISTSTKIEGVTWEGSESDLLELFKTLKTLGKVECNADNDTELLPILKATFEGVNSGVTWKGSENEFYELFKALWLCKYIKPFENTDVSLFKFLGGAMGKDIRALGQMKQRNADKKRYLCDELIKEDITKGLKELLKTIRTKFYDFVNE